MVGTTEKNEKAFCLKCKKFYPEKGMAFQKCPKGHKLLHRTYCQYCDTSLYFQCDDDYCGPDWDQGIICHNCAKKMSMNKK